MSQLFVVATKKILQHPVCYTPCIFKPNKVFFYFQHALKVHIDSRRLLLRYLRETDYKKFEWLLEKLNIAYKPRPLVFLLERKLLANK